MILRCAQDDRWPFALLRVTAGAFAMFGMTPFASFRIAGGLCGVRGGSLRSLRFDHHSKRPHLPKHVFLNAVKNLLAKGKPRTKVGGGDE